MDEFLVGLTHCAALKSTCCDDRKSRDLDRKRKYTQGQIVSTLTTHLQSHTLSDSVPLPPASKPSLLPPGCSLSTTHSSFNRQRLVSVHAIHVDFNDGTSFDIPASANKVDHHVAKAYINAVRAIDNDPHKFTSTSECAVCEGTIHPFFGLQGPQGRQVPLEASYCLLCQPTASQEVACNTGCGPCP